LQEKRLFCVNLKVFDTQVGSETWKKKKKKKKKKCKTELSDLKKSDYCRTTNQQHQEALFTFY